MFKKHLSDGLAAIALVVLIVLLFGFYNAMSVTALSGPPQQAEVSPSGQAGAPSATPAAKKSNSFELLILGDSIAKGTGDEKGQGFDGYLSQSFKNNTSKDISVQNVGVDGLESLGLLNQIKAESLNQTISDADLILISIGGNDLRRVLSADDISKTAIFKSNLDSYVQNLRETLQILRSNNPDCLIVVLGIYDPYEGTTSPGDTLLLHEWNYNTQELVSSGANIIFVPTYDLMKFNLNRYLAPDGLHPNSAGYQAISSRINSTVSIIVAQ
jgi:lysophospholipase L1-like esterase